MKMERFFEYVLILVTFLFNVKFVAGATGGLNISPDILYASFAVGGAAVVVAVAIILCSCICRIHKKRTVGLERESLVEKGGISPRNPLTTNRHQGYSSCKLFIQKEVGGRVEKKKREGEKRVKYSRTSPDPKQPEESRLFSFNRTLNASNIYNAEGVVGKTVSSCITRKGELKADVHTKRQKPFAKKKEHEKNVSAVRGLFENKFEILASIGEGTFGFVKSAIRKIDFKQVVVKFIIKAKVSSWTQDGRYGRVPHEVGILRKIEHPNIVKVIDVFENEEFVQMVMEKHGSGMDLYEFSRRKVCLGETLASFIFRQAVEAVAHLHSRNIVHRDIKSENIVIDESFRVKLIDFGTAAYFKQGSETFSAICGTFEFLSPEILFGKMYEGPQQDMWALGVTLYDLTFEELPFANRKEIIQNPLSLPFAVTNSLRLLLKSLLEKDPKNRATILDCQNSSWLTQPVNISNYKWCDVVPQ